MAIHLSRRNLLLAGIAGSLLNARALHASESDSPVTALAQRIVKKTVLGGHEWTDVFIHGSWRIERNVVSKLHRFRDPKGNTLAVGDLADCRVRFERLQAEGKIEPLKPRAIVLLHGLLRSRDSMKSLGAYLSHRFEAEIINFGYVSTQGETADHAAALKSVIAGLADVREFDLVCHSLGNIVVRHWMAESLKRQGTIDSRVRRMVMLGPPNQGAQAAKRLDSKLFGMVTGRCGCELAAEWHMLKPKLCTPPCEFGILAGDRIKMNPLIDGDDDFCVSVEETKLAGAADFAVLPLHHGELRSSRLSWERTATFLEHGWFESEQRRRPLTDS